MRGKHRGEMETRAGRGIGRAGEGLEGLAGYTEAGSAVPSAGGQTEPKGEQDQILRRTCVLNWKQNGI